MLRKRLFIAIPWQADAVFDSKIKRLQSYCARDLIRWERPDHYHLTLVFLGGIATDRIPLLQTTLQKVVQQHQTFDLQLKGLRQFGSHYQSRVLWFGVEPSAALEALHQDIVLALKDIGMRPFGHTYIPHISIARVKKIADRAFFRKVMESQKDKAIQSTKIQEIVLFESLLQSKGAEHIVVERYELKERNSKPE